MACKRSSVRSRLPPPIFVEKFEESFWQVLVVKQRPVAGSSKVLTPSSRGLGHYPFTVGTGVRIPVGSPEFFAATRRHKAQVGNSQSARAGDLARKSERVATTRSGSSVG